MGLEDVFDVVKERVLDGLIVKAGSGWGSDLCKVYVSVWDVRNIVYDVLMNIELDNVKMRWKGIERLDS